MEQFGTLETADAVLMRMVLDCNMQFRECAEGYGYWKWGYETLMLVWLGVLEGWVVLGIMCLG